MHQNCWEVLALTTVRIRFEKTGEASYISLLDMQRVMQRVLKRSGLSVWYTMGFNPHIYMTFSCPLPLGQESLCESVDVKTEDDNADFSVWMEKLNAIMPTGIHVYKVAPVDKKADSIAFADYTIRYDAAGAAMLDAYNAAEQALVEKKSKRATKTIDLKEIIPTLPYETEGDKVVFRLRLPASGSMNVNPSLLTGYLDMQFGLPASDAEVLRTGLVDESGEAF